MSNIRYKHDDGVEYLLNQYLRDDIFDTYNLLGITYRVQTPTLFEPIVHDVFYNPKHRRLARLNLTNLDDCYEMIDIFFPTNSSFQHQDPSGQSFSLTVWSEGLANDSQEITIIDYTHYAIVKAVVFLFIKTKGLDISSNVF